MKKIIYFLIGLLAIIGALAYIYFAIVGGDVLMAKIIDGVWGRILNGLIGVCVLASMFVNRNLFK